MTDQATTAKVVVQCGACAAKFRLGAQFAGKTIKCPKCSAPISVPELAPPDPAAPAADPARAATIIASAASGYDAGAVFDSDAELMPVQAGGSPPPATPAPPARGATRRIDRDGREGGSKKGTTRRLKKDAEAAAGRPMMNRAPTTQDDDPFSRKRVDEDSSRREVGAAVAAPQTGVRSRTQTIRRDNLPGGARGNTRRIQPGMKKQNNMPMLVAAIGGGLLVLIVLIAMVSGGGGNASSGSNSGVADGGNPDSGSETNTAEQQAERLKFATDQFQTDWTGANDPHRKMEVIAHWFGQLETFPSLKSEWESRFESALREARGAITSGLDDDEQARRLVSIGQWAMKCDKADAGKRAFRDALDLDPQNQGAQAGLGYKKYTKPTDDEFAEMEMESLTRELDQYDGLWLSPDEYEDVMAIEKRVVEAGRAKMDLWKKDPFERMAHSSVLTLKSNTYFDQFEFETFVARPFVVLQTRPKGSSAGGSHSWDQRADEMDGLLKGIWREWLKIRTHWDLNSSRASEGDTLDNPIPFVWVSFHNQQAYDEYQEKAQRALPPGARAFYDAKTRMVMFWEEPGTDTADVVIHETIHQLMDRFSDLMPTQYQNHCFTEGAPEFYAGYSGHGSDFRMAQFNQPGRARDISTMRTWFDAKKGVTWPPGARDQITPSDWVFFDVPLLMTMRDIVFVRNISAQLAGQCFARSPYVRRRACRAMIQRGEVTFHSMFYAYAWAFTYWLNQEYPEQYNRYAKTIMKTDRGGDAEVFLECFNMRAAAQLPNIYQYCGDGNKLLGQGRNAQLAFNALAQRVTILRATPAVQDMHRRWVAWMESKFPKNPNGPPDGDISLWPSDGDLPGFATGGDEAVSLAPGLTDRQDGGASFFQPLGQVTVR